MMIKTDDENKMILVWCDSNDDFNNIPKKEKYKTIVFMSGRNNLDHTLAELILN